jgi:endonuclease YncB( thermonuclease family)
MNRTLLAAVVSVMATAAAHAVDNPRTGEPAVLHPTIVAIDGDTLAVGAERVRIIGLDTPETYQAQCPAELRAGYAAHGRLQHLLNTRTVRIERAGLDKYKRTLAVVHVGQDDVADIMVREGYARSYICPNGRCPARQPWCP